VSEEITIRQVTVADVPDLRLLRQQARLKSQIAHFDHLEQHLLEGGAVSSYTVVRREVTPTDGKVRIRAQLRDGGLLELEVLAQIEVKLRPGQGK